MELIHNLYNLTNRFIIILINNTILHRFSIKTAAAELAPSEANHMAGRWVYGQEVEQGVVCFRPVTKNWEWAAGLVLWRWQPGVEASGLHHSNGMGALDFATSHLASHMAIRPLTQFASNEASHVFLML